MEPKLALEQDWFATKNSERRTLELEWVVAGIATELRRYVRAALHSPDRPPNSLEPEYGMNLAHKFFDAALLGQNLVVLTEHDIEPPVRAEESVRALTEEFRLLLFDINLERRGGDDDEYVSLVASEQALNFVRCGYRALGLTKVQAQSLLRFLEQRRERGRSGGKVGKVDGVLSRSEDSSSIETLETIVPRLSNFERYLELRNERDAAEASPELPQQEEVNESSSAKGPGKRS